MRIAGADKAVDNVIEWALRDDDWARQWAYVLAEHLAPACDEFGIEPEELEPTLGSDAFGNVFACATEDFLSSGVSDEDSNVVDVYLKRRGWREKGAARTYLRALRGSTMSLYEVVDIVPGHHLYLRDLIRGGETVRADERLGSQTAARWDRVALRLLSIGSMHCLAGGVLHFPHEAAAALLEVINTTARQERTAAKRRAKRAGLAVDIPLETVKVGVLPTLAPIFTRAWLLYTLGQRSQPMPHLVNFDGHDIELTEVRYPLPPNAATEIERRLDAAPRIERDSEDVAEWTWLRDAPRPAAAPSRGSKQALSFDSESEDGRWTFARIGVKPDMLVLNCNSRERAEMATARLAEILDDLIGTPLTSVQTLEQAMAERAERGDENVTPETVPPEIAGPLLKQVLDDHYRKCLRQPIGMLDGKTPRQALRSKKGRAQVVEWLKYLENSTSRQALDDPAMAYDLTWMWEELGIADLRK